MKPLLLLYSLSALFRHAHCGAASYGVQDLNNMAELDTRATLQDIVTWDENSLFINGERLMLFSGEIHPFRLPVPSLWLDVFQKLRAIGFNTVSFYLDWALLEGKAGDVRVDGVFALEPFFAAAKKAGVYLIARPGPYIQAEVSGGGLPGWIQRLKGHPRTSDPDYLAATNTYMDVIGKKIAAAQITNGGPVILLQPENEYMFQSGLPVFPDRAYIQYVINQARNAGVRIPLISNDGNQDQRNITVPGFTDVDILGYDTYPLGFNCANPSHWNSGRLPWGFSGWHKKVNPTAPLAIGEYQGGAYDPWGGPGFDNCAALLNHEFERVFCKSNCAAKTSIFSIYMIFGGTNWGNLGYDVGYTSYDYGAALAEDRTVTREKYAELNLQANFFAVSPDYLVSKPGDATVGVHASSDFLTVNPLNGNGSSASFYVVRHTDYTSPSWTSYNLTLPTSAGKITIPQLGGSLRLMGRDSKVHVVDYDVGGTKLLYSTAEVFTWKQFSNSKVLLVYGGLGEVHELAVKSNGQPSIIEGQQGLTVKTVNGVVIANWETSSSRRLLKLGSFYIYILNRNDAYSHWVTTISGGIFQAQAKTVSSLIVRGGYLVRNASISGDILQLSADFNTTTQIEILGAPTNAKKLSINGQNTPFMLSSVGTWLSNVTYSPPVISLPDLTTSQWLSIDTLPEIAKSYDDSAWPKANLKMTNNTMAPLKTPVSLYGSDYGFHSGVLVYRGHFTASGNESALSILTQGGSAGAAAFWLNGKFLGSWVGSAASSSQTTQLNLTGSGLQSGKDNVFTVVVDNNGYKLSPTAGRDDMKNPRGIMSYTVKNASGGTLNTNIQWSITGNLGGEDYIDKTRGPLNEGGFFAERQGLHLPNPPSTVNGVALTTTASPLDGLAGPGAKLYTTKFSLGLPSDKYDIPLSVEFTPSKPTGAFRALLYINGWQFGKLAGNLGPQFKFYVPEGVLNYNGQNQISVLLWALEGSGAKFDKIALVASRPVWTGRSAVQLVQSPGWAKRGNAY